MFHGISLKRLTGWMALVILAAAMGGPVSAGTGEGALADLRSLLPEIEGWNLSEDLETYRPDNLFEYINGAAEIYISYDFHELLVAQFKRNDADLSIEIYDMGSVKNGFGIYSAERYPDNSFRSIGIQGYLEEDSLNFLAGRYYVKLLCFGGPDGGESLVAFARGIAARVSDPGKFPALLDAFPAEGRIANTEKFALRNFLGYAFLGSGYQTDYLLDGEAFSCFIIPAGSPEQAVERLGLFLEKKKDLPVEKIPDGYRIRDRYYRNIFVDAVGSHICGVMKIPDGMEETGIFYLNRLREFLSR